MHVFYMLSHIYTPTKENASYKRLGLRESSSKKKRMVPAKSVLGNSEQRRAQEPSHSRKQVRPRPRPSAGAQLGLRWPRGTLTLTFSAFVGACLALSWHSFSNCPSPSKAARLFSNIHALSGASPKNWTWYWRALFL